MYYSSPRKYPYNSRYCKYRQIIDNKDTYTETFNQTLVNQSDNDIYHIVQTEEENRLDIISKKYYGDAQYFWVIALANDLIDPLVVVRDTVLRIPSMTSLYQWEGALYKYV